MDRTPATYEQLQQLLNEESCDKYFITHHNGKFNHMSHALYAMYQMQFSLDEMKTWIKRTEPTLETKEEHLDEPESATIPIADLKGKKLGFYRLVDHYKTLLKDKHKNNLDELVRAEFPSLADGVATYVLHALLQLGYGYAARNPQVTCEGLAFLNHHYKQLKFPSTEELFAPNLGYGYRDLFEVLYDLPNIHQIYRMDVTHRKISSEYTRINYLAWVHGDKLLGRVNHVAIDDQITRDLKKVCHWLITQAIKIFSTAEVRNDFFIMHLVSGAYALCELLPLFDRQVADGFIKVMLCGIFMVYIDQGNPRFYPDTKAIEKAKNLHWSDLIPRAADSKNYPQFDVHVLKLTAICHKLYRETNDEDEKLLYKTAAFQCIDYPFRFSKEGE